MTVRKRRRQQIWRVCSNLSVRSYWRKSTISLCMVVAGFYIFCHYYYNVCAIVAGYSVSEGGFLI